MLTLAHGATSVQKPFMDCTRLHTTLRKGTFFLYQKCTYSYCFRHETLCFLSTKRAWIRWTAAPRRQLDVNSILKRDFNPRFRSTDTGCSLTKHCPFAPRSCIKRTITVLLWGSPRNLQDSENLLVEDGEHACSSCGQAKSFENNTLNSIHVPLYMESCVYFQKYRKCPNRPFWPYHLCLRYTCTRVASFILRDYELHTMIHGGKLLHIKGSDNCRLFIVFDV